MDVGTKSHFLAWLKLCGLALLLAVVLVIVFSLFGWIGPAVVVAALFAFYCWFYWSAVARRLVAPRRDEARAERVVRDVQAAIQRGSSRCPSSAKGTLRTRCSTSSQWSGCVRSGRRGSGQASPQWS